MPPIDVKNEMIIATKGGSKIFVFTPDTGNRIFNKSTFSPPRKNPTCTHRPGLFLDGSDRDIAYGLLFGYADHCCNVILVVDNEDISPRCRRDLSPSYLALLIHMFPLSQWHGNKQTMKFILLLSRNIYYSC